MTTEFKKGNQIYFPLSAIRYSNDKNTLINHILSYGIIEYAHKIQLSNYRLDGDDLEAIERKAENISDYDLITDSNSDNLQSYIIHSANVIGIKIASINKNETEHRELLQHISKLENESGKSPVVKLNKDLLFDVRDNGFSLDLFRVYCAIKSIIGKKIYCRITKDRIRYRMHGFKNEMDYINSGDRVKLLSDYQIGNLCNKLKDLNLISTFTYKKRIKYFSTRWNEKHDIENPETLTKFEIYIINQIANREIRKQQKRDSFINAVIAEQINSYSLKKEQPALELIKTGTHN